MFRPLFVCVLLVAVMVGVHSTPGAAPPCAIGEYVPVATCVTCTIKGTYCPGNMANYAEPCEAGYYCPTPAEKKRCPSGSYCPAGVDEPVDCLWWTLSSCEAGSTKPSTGLGGLVILLLFIIIVGAIAQIFNVRQNRKRFMLHERLMTLSKTYNPLCEKKHPEEFRKMKNAENTMKCLKPLDKTFDFDFYELGLQLPNGKKILSGVTGRFTHGRLVAVMGPSGAGKTTFLTVLTGKVTKTSGKILINGQRVDIQAYKKLVGFVPQEDVMMRTLTVRENLLMSAKLRLPVSVPRRDRLRIVDDVLNILDLTDVQHTIIGDEKRRGVSGGQRKRVNIGIEMCANPSVLFLDEPTSGLDSSSALQVAECLRMISHKLLLTVITVIHQPRFTVYQMFDDVLLLGKGGRTVYLGPSDDSVEYFKSLGFECPATENPADYLMDVIAGKVPRIGHPEFHYTDLFHLWEKRMEELKQEQSDQKELDDAAAVAAAGSDGAVVGAGTGAAVASSSGQRRRLFGKKDLSGRHTPGFLLQTWHFMVRALVQQGRATKENGVDIFLVVLAGCLLGGMYGGETSVYEGPVPQAVQDMCSPSFAKVLCALPRRDVLSVFGTTTLAIGLTSLMAALRCFGDEVIVYWRESSSGVNTLSYFVGKNIAQMVNITIMPFVFLAGFYGLMNPRGYFVYYWMTTYVTTFAGYGLGYLVSVAFSGSVMQLAGVVAILISVLVGGTSPTLKEMDDMGFLGKILYSISYARYAIEMFYVKEIERYKDVYDISNSLNTWDYDIDHYWPFIGIMIAMGVICRVLAYFVLRFTNRSKQM